MRYSTRLGACASCAQPPPRFAGLGSRPAIMLAAAPIAPDVESSALFEASGIMISGIGSVIGLTLYALGHTKAAAAFGAGSVLVGATIAAARVLNQG